MRGFARISAAVPAVAPADFAANRKNVLALWKEAHADSASLVVFPELCLCAYTVRDLVFDQHLLDASLATLLELAREGRSLGPMALVGLPLRVGSRLFNVCAALQGGRVLGIVPKAYLPNYREFEELRWFRPGFEVEPGSTARVGGQDVPFGMDVLFEASDVPDLVVGVEICEDCWVQVPPSVFQVSAGATVVCNPSASNFLVGKADLRRMLARSLADRGKCVYAYVASGPGESSTDLAFDADAFISENGHALGSTRRFERGNQLLTVDVDLEALIHDRLVTNSFGECARQWARPFRRLPFTAGSASSAQRKELKRTVSAHPFLPKDPQTLASRCWEIFEIQTNALATRALAAGSKELVLGLSGGLDSTQAALVSAAALDQLGRPRKDLLCVTMPGLGTSAGTRSNAEKLARGLGASFREIPVSEGSHLVLRAVGHPAAQAVDSVDALIARLREVPDLGDTSLENVQARLRTLILMTLANQHGGLVVGTGDLSEKALGWSTYAGDHIAMYDVNAGVPKTLIQFVIRWVANERVQTWSKGGADELRATLFAILDTPISPELLPTSGEGGIAQLTEETIGPYELHDFFLYHFVRFGSRPARILDLARVAFAGRYELSVLKNWLKLFYRRFFNNQFKRSCTADAPKVGMVALSPRGDWRMPSDARVSSWIEDVESYAASERE